MEEWTFFIKKNNLTILDYSEVFDGPIETLMIKKLCVDGLVREIMQTGKQFSGPAAATFTFLPLLSRTTFLSI